MTPKEFIYRYNRYANMVAVRYGVPSLVTLSQAAWESGWGRSAPKFNFFGMTAGSNYTGKKQFLSTFEYVNGQKVKVKRAFRAYDSPVQAFADYAYNLANKPNYSEAFKYRRGNPEMFLKKVFEGGYATDPNYLTNTLKIMSMIKKYVS